MAWGTVLLLAAFAQIVLGALVAGIDAGRSYIDWPLMAGELLPASAFDLERSGATSSTIPLWFSSTIACSATCCSVSHGRLAAQSAERLGYFGAPLHWSCWRSSCRWCWDVTVLHAAPCTW